MQAPRVTRSRLRVFRRAAGALVLGTLASGCGFGTGGILAAAGGGGGSTNAPSTPAGLLVLDGKLSPARIRIVMTDAEADTATVDFFYVVPSDPGNERPLTQLAENPAKLAASPQGVTHELPWDFAREAGLPASGSFVDQVTLIARVRGGVTQSTVVGLGNDLPVVDTIVPPAAEITGIADVSFRVRDTSGDAVDVEVEFLDESAPELGWRRARPAGADGTSTGPAFRGVTAPPAGERLTFFWDTNSRDAQGNAQGDLVALERDVRVRFRALDPVTVPAEAPFVESASFHIDNNEQPVVQVNGDAVVASGDRRRTVSVPVTVRDAESDPVDVVMQWRRLTDPAFPDLGTTDPATLRALLQDDGYVRDKQICRTGLLAATGTARWLDARHLRTDDLALTQAWVLPQGIVGRTIDLLRPIAAPAVIASAAWASNPLTRPVAVLPGHAATEAIVLDDTAGSASVRIVDVTTGTVVRNVASAIPGTPTAMCRAKAGASLLVATQSTTGWLLHEVSLADGAVAQRAAGLPPLVNASVRGLVATHDRIALLTVDSQLLRVDWNDLLAPRIVTVLANLTEPIGVALDPHDRGRVFVAERTRQGSGRIAAWDLETRLPVAFLPALAAPERPSAIAVDADGRQLLVVSEPLAGGRTLRRYVLGGPAGAGVFAPMNLPAGTSAIAGGHDGLLLLVEPQGRQLLVQGGVGNQRVVTAYDPATMTLTLDADLPATSAILPWRIAVANGRDIRTSPGGRRESILWDTQAVAGIGPIALRTFAIDSEFGASSETAAGISFLPDEHDAQTLPGGGAIVGLADLDGDGDLDVNGGGTVFRQTSPRSFTGTAVTPTASLAFDANGDGRNDLIETGTQVRIFHQNASGQFPTTASQVISIAANRILDVDGDGRFDLVNVAGAVISVRLQTAGGTFAAAQTVTSTVPAGDIVSVDLVDLTSDGRLDISIVARENQISASNYFDCRVRVHAQATDGSFAATPTFQILLAGDYAANLADYGDVDGDGRTDILLSQPFVPDIFVPVIPSHITVLFQGPAGVFTDRFRFDKSGAGFLSTGLGDVDGDGLLEVLGTTQTLRQIGPRRFVDQQLPAGGRPFVDIDGDGSADEVAGNALRYRTGRGRLGAASQAVPGSTMGDFNGDGLIDAGSSSTSFGSGGTVLAFLQTPGAAFPPTADYSRSLSTGGDSPPFIGLQVGDVSGDGIVDLVSQVISDNGSRVRGEGVIDPNQPQLTTSTFFMNTGAGVLSLRDFDGDGRLDLAASHQQASDIGEFKLFTRSGSGFQLAGQQNQLPNRTTSFAWGDLDGDGRTDLVVGTSDGRASVYRQDTNGALLLPPTTVGAATGSGARVDVVDLDGDGFPDLLLGRSGAGITVFYGNGSAVPVSGQSLSATAVQAGVHDVDGDGDLDIVDTNGNLLAQLAPRQFVLYPGPFGASLDFDLDGEVDTVQFASVQFAGR